MELLDLYRLILKAAGAETDKEGYVSIMEDGQKQPFFVEGERLVLPTDEHLAGDKKGIVLFHPLLEYITRAEPPVMAAYRRQLAESLHIRFLALGCELLTIAASQKKHAQLNPEQKEFLTYVPDADEQMLKNWMALIEAMEPGQNQKIFTSIYLRRGGKFEGKIHQRVAVVTFPLYEQLVKDGEEREALMEQRKANKKKDEKLPTIPNETYGVALRTKDRESFIKMIQYMVPGVENEGAYWAASDSQIAPNIDAVMHAAERVGGALNTLVDRFKSVIGDGVEALRMEDRWVESFVNLAPLAPKIKMLPMQKGNEGGLVKSAEAQAALAQEAVGAQTPPGKVEVEQATTAAPEEEAAAPSGFRLPPRREPAHHAQPAYHAPQQQAPQHHPQHPPYQHHQQPPYQAPQGQPPHQAGGITMQDVMRNNPAVAGMAYQGGYRGPQQGGPQQEVPSWAQGGYGQPGGYRSKF
jgi:hypothetical protein